MNDENLKTGPDIELDLRTAVETAAQYWRSLLISAILGAVLAGAAAWWLLPPQYQSSVLFYVNNSAATEGSSVSSGDLSTSRNLVNSYIVILKTRESLLDVIRYAGVDVPYQELEDMISASDVNKTEFFRVVVTGSDPYEAEKIANAIGQILPEKIAAIIEGTTARMVEPAIAAWKPELPNYGSYAALGFLGGLTLSLILLLLWKLTDETIRSPEELENLCAYPVLASVKVPKNKRKTDPDSQMAEVCRQVRTKIPFLLPGDTCRVIGISGAAKGEGIHRTAEELERSLTCLKRKVLLVDGDLRREGRRSEHSVDLRELLSNALGAERSENAGENFVGKDAMDPLDLLSSGEMKAFLRRQREEYEDILLALPPAGEYSDILAVAEELDGVLLVVGLDRCSRRQLQKALRQLEFGKLRVLGLVCVAGPEEKR